MRTFVRSCLLLVLVAFVAPAAAHSDRPAPCPDGRFPLVGVRPTGREGTPDTIVFQGGSVALDGVCAPQPARVRATPRNTTIRVNWSTCPGLEGRVKLKARIAAPACDRLSGTITVDARPRKRRLRDVARAAAFNYEVPLDPYSPWPKFRRTAVQDGRSPIRPSQTGGHLWSFPTGRGVFSTPVVDGDGNVYVGSADRTFYALAADGSLRWQLLTGEIIDSAALLDDRGRVYFGSGDGKLRARDAASGAEVWTFDAEPPSVSGAFINWFEGNVALGADGTLYVPNDNFFTYALDRDTADVRWRFRTSDQTWSLPAVNVATGRVFLGNNPARGAVGLHPRSGDRPWCASEDVHFLTYIGPFRVEAHRAGGVTRRAATRPTSVAITTAR